ncbi:outer membrane protein Iml2/Tetratricopeptide repeat protein 39 [Trametes elegans]|nr:outer membrane protein Iml2/Tetratricopeptide repeat protein 39 [Trametes elegans]
MTLNPQETEAQLRAATIGFDWLFSNELDKARETFSSGNSPFHSLGLGVCAFLQAALGMETGLMAEASRLLALAEAGAKNQLKLAKSSTKATQFPPGTEWELLHSDAVILLGLTHALSESYMGYLQCLYAMNSAHSKFSRLFKTVYPNGLQDYATPAASSANSRAASIRSEVSGTSSQVAAPKPARSGFFSRLTGASLTVPTTPHAPIVAEEGSVDELVLSGAAFGFGLFNLVFSLLPAKIRGVVGFFGFNHDRKLALQSLAVSATKNDVHGVFAGLSLMTYHGVVLLLAGYQANEAHILKQYHAIVDKLESRYPTGSLWILNRAKILRMSYDPDGAIKVLQGGLAPGRPHTFAQADTMLLFELAWTLLSQRRYQEAADAFIRVTEINSWSHATYYFIAAGCYVSLHNYEKAHELFEKIPELIDKKKIGGKDLPTEVFIKKKRSFVVAFYKEKQKAMTGSEDNYPQAMKISPAEELGVLVWNTHARITEETAIAHLKDWATRMNPPPAIETDMLKKHVPPPPRSADEAQSKADTADELAVRSLLLGIVHRTAGDYAGARAYLGDAEARNATVKVSTWVGGVAWFEHAVLDLKEMEARSASGTPGGLVADADEWARALKGALEKLDKALSLATQQVDLSSRLDTRIAMLKDEIALKKEMLGIVS